MFRLPQFREFKTMKLWGLSTILWINMLYGFFYMLRRWLPFICSDETFIQISSLLLIFNVLTVLLWFLIRASRYDDKRKNN